MLDRFKAWLLPKVNQGMTNQELYDKIAALAGNETFSIERQVWRHAPHGEPEAPTASVRTHIWRDGTIAIHVEAASNGELWALIQLENSKLGIRPDQDYVPATDTEPAF